MVIWWNKSLMYNLFYLVFISGEQLVKSFANLFCLSNHAWQQFGHVFSHTAWELIQLKWEGELKVKSTSIKLTFFLRHTFNCRYSSNRYFTPRFKRITLLKYFWKIIDLRCHLCLYCKMLWIIKELETWSLIRFSVFSQNIFSLLSFFQRDKCKFLFALEINP